jgi:DNA-binding NtrC family response regulator
VSEDGYKPRILIVDDEHNIADTLALVFKIKGHESVATYSAESAVELIETFEPDIVLSDVVMGKMTGVDLAIYLSKARPDCKVVLFSGQASTHDLLAEAGRKGHHFHLLAKPIHPEKLLEDLMTAP